MAILPLGHNYNLASPGMLGSFYFGGTVVLAPGTERLRSVCAWSNVSA
jgi:2,3-dihydroxybenzoate-AMP ligase